VGFSPRFAALILWALAPGVSFVPTLHSIPHPRVPYNYRMSTVTDHYERLLAQHYTWMFGTSFDETVAEQKSLLAPTLRPLIPTHASALAVDLGSGPGFQSIALAQLGFSPVIAIDTSAALLSELRTHAVRLPIQTHHADLRSLAQLVPAARAAAIVCMGDTITHLPAHSDVAALFASIHAALTPGGIFILTWRDLTPELHGTDRFLPVRSDDTTVMTCFLEYTAPETVLVHDLIYTRDVATPDSPWSLNKSSYPKLRLSPAWLAKQLTAAGLTIESQGPAGRLQHITARKPQ
jgi:SAM-dependent methyltransferase